MKRNQARENAFILLFESFAKSDETPEEIFEKATEIRGLEIDEYVKKVFFGATENRKVIDECIEKAIVGWRKERISTVSKAILALACYEMMFMEDIPGIVSINEGVELSKKFDGDNVYTFVNGTLNKIAESLGKK